MKVAILSLVIIISSIAIGITLNEEDGKIILHYSFDKIFIEKINLYNQTFDRIQIEGLPLLNNPGKPRLPFKTAKILLPPQHIVNSIEILPKKKSELMVEIIEPALKPVPYNILLF